MAREQGWSRTGSSECQGPRAQSSSLHNETLIKDVKLLFVVGSVVKGVRPKGIFVMVMFLFLMETSHRDRVFCGVLIELFTHYT